MDISLSCEMMMIKVRNNEMKDELCQRRKRESLFDSLVSSLFYISIFFFYMTKTRMIMFSFHSFFVGFEYENEEFE